MGSSPSLVSQEQLVRKAASLCYLLSNEGTISLVSEDSSVLPVLFFLIKTTFVFSLREFVIHY